MAQKLTLGRKSTICVVITKFTMKILLEYLLDLVNIVGVFQ